jgi:hypothetical protein
MRTAAEYAENIEAFPYRFKQKCLSKLQPKKDGEPSQR